MLSSRSTTIPNMHTPNRTKVPFPKPSALLLLLAIGLLFTASLMAGVFPNGVNLQPAYYNGGNVNFGWSLMNSKSAIKTCRLEIDPSRGISISQMQSWISQAKSNGKTLICTYHFFGGSDSAADLNTAATWWKNNYSALNSAGSFTINLCNEWGDHNLTASAYASAYNGAISIVRSVYGGSIICDVPGWGQEDQIAQQASPSITDRNIIFSAHIYPGNFDQNQNRANIASDLDVLASSGRPCMLGEFGTGSGSTDWSGIVDHANSLGWTVLAWSWNGDGGVLNMCSPSWASNPTATSFTTSSYFNTVYPKLGSGGGTTYYKLQNVGTGLCIDGLGATANGANCGQWASGSSFNQQWAIVTVGSSVRLQNRATGLCIDGMGLTANGSIAGQWGNTGSNNQLWTQSTSGSNFKYQNRATGLCLDGLGATVNGSNLGQWTSGSSNNQLFSRTAQ